MTRKTVKGGWCRIDEAEDPTHFVRLMDKTRGDDTNPAQYEIVKEMLRLRQGQSVLDVGCGTGGAVRAFADVVGSAGNSTGVDCSKTMLDVANDRSRGLSLPVRFQLADAQQLPFPDNHFDGTFALRLFEIVDSPALVLKEMFRVTKPGGRIFVNAPDVDCWTFDSPDRTTTRAIIHYFCDSEVNGWIGRQLPRMFGELEGSSINVVSQSFYSSDFDLIHRLFLKETIQRAIQTSALPSATADNWLTGFRMRCTTYPFGFSQNVVRVVAAKSV